MTRQIVMLGALALLCLTSCTSETLTPEEKMNFLTQDRVERFIVKGKTTKEQVIAEFGTPTSAMVTNSDVPGMPYEILSYGKTYDSEVAILLVQLDHEGIVTGYTFNSTGPITQSVGH